jgi:two-component system cell cycle sensor histidine kinase PleC
MTREQLLAHIVLLKRRIVREARVRRKAEELLEAKSSELTNAGRSLLEVNANLERLVQERTEELKAVRDDALAASKAKSEFLTSMSHELRTPLNAIIGFSEIMRIELMGPIENALYRNYAGNIHDSGQHLLGVINDILDVSKIEAGRMELHEGICDVAEIIAEVVRLLGDNACRAGVVVHIALQPGLPRITADQGKIRQILLNLLSNSIKFTPKDGIITVSAQLSASGAFVFAVADTGVGIPAAEIENVMEAFVQLGDVLTRAQNGSGLGLPLCKALTEMHSGFLALESEVGKGTCVTVSLPKLRVLKPTNPA